MITELPVSISEAGPIMETIKPNYVFFRAIAGAVVEALCCDTVEEAMEVNTRLKGKPGRINVGYGTPSWPEKSSAGQA